MDLEYDIFEKLPNGDVVWRGSVKGRDKGIQRLGELAKRSPNEHFAMHTPTKEIIARMNVPLDDPAKPE